MEYRPSGFNILPPVVKNLLIINAIFFLATWVLESRGIPLTDILGLHYFSADKFRPYQLITYMFMHGNFGHIFFNMFAVWMFGNALENVWGSKRFLTYYVITGIGAALIQYLVLAFQFSPILDAINFTAYNPTPENIKAFMNSGNFSINPLDAEMLQKYRYFVDSYNTLVTSGQNQTATQLAHDYLLDYRADLLNQPVVVGASGALFGLLLAFGMIFPNTLIFLYFAIPIKAKYFVMLYGAIELFLGISNNAGDNVAHFAHLGGMLFGWILIRNWRKHHRREF